MPYTEFGSTGLISIRAPVSNGPCMYGQVGQPFGNLMNEAQAGKRGQKVIFDSDHASPSLGVAKGYTYIIIERKATKHARRVHLWHRFNSCFPYKHCVKC